MRRAVVTNHPVPPRNSSRQRWLGFSIDKRRDPNGGAYCGFHLINLPDSLPCNGQRILLLLCTPLELRWPQQRSVLPDCNASRLQLHLNQDRHRKLSVSH